MPRPAKGTEEGRALLAKEAEIQAALNDPATPPETLARLRDEHHDMVLAHIKKEAADLGALQQQVDSGQLSPADELAAKTQIAKMKADLDPFMGSRVDRNEASLNDPNLSHVQMDIANVRRTDDGKALVTYVDGTQRVYDRVIPGIGADPNAPGGVSSMLSKLPPEMKLLPVIENGRPVGLMSDPPGVTISGAAAVGTTGVPPPEIMARIPKELQDAYIASVQEWANRPGVSHGSKGIVPGIENVGSNAAEMQTAKQRSPEERQQLLDQWASRFSTRADAIAAFSDPSFLAELDGQTPAPALAAE
jgi:hypothetical protein